VATDFVAEIDVDRRALFRAIDTFVEVFPKRDLGKVIGSKRSSSRATCSSSPRRTPASRSTRASPRSGRSGRTPSPARSTRCLPTSGRSAFSTTRKSPAVGEHARQLLDGKRYDELQKFLVDCGYGYRVRENSVISEPTETEHNKHRDRRGRVHENLKTKFWIGVSGSV
jgi:hypothetical protein